MREQARKPENTSRTIQSDSKASKQAPISEILQAYKEGALGRRPIQREEKPNNTGLPDNLKTGIENLSGYGIDDVKVHYNSDKPAQLQALAYTQGTDIHVAPGQEQHLPHEAWHVVQQKQGRVQPTMQLQGVNVNDNEGLEKEADVMGGKITQKKLIPFNYITNQSYKINNQTTAIPLQFTLAKTLKEIKLHKKNDTKEIKSKIMIPAKSLIEIDEMDVWERDTGNRMLNAEYNGDKGYIKDRKDYWTTDIKKLKEDEGESEVDKWIKNKKLIEDICNELGVEEDLLKQSVDIIKESTVGNIEYYLLQQLSKINEEWLKKSIIIQGIARGLAERLGDLNSENRIARKLVEKLSLGSEKPDLDIRINSFARSNPVLKYMHRELNLHDTAILIMRRAARIRNRTGAITNEEMLEKLSKMAFIGLSSLTKSMHTEKKNSFDKSNTFGLFSTEFLAEHIKSEGWTETATKKLGMLTNKISELTSKSRDEKVFLTPGEAAVKEAKENDETMKGKKNEAIESLKKTKNIDKNEAEKKIETMLQLLENADITIIRNSKFLLERDLKDEAVLKSGHIPKYISLNDLLNMKKRGELPHTLEQTDKGISYVPISEIHGGSYYSAFRSYKDHLFSGMRWKKIKGPLFGALDYDKKGLNGMNEMGHETYGNVLFILNKDKIKEKIIYTNTPKGKGFQNLEMFLYDLILPQKDIYDMKFNSKTIFNDLFAAVDKKEEKVNIDMKLLEVQIYTDIPLNNKYIKEVIFASDVAPNERDAIKAKFDSNQSDGIEFKAYPYLEITSLIRKERIKTTLVKAKELRRVIEKIITKARVKSLHNIRTVAKLILDKDMLKKLFDDVAPRYKERNGGYTRIIKLGKRAGDNADLAYIEFVEESVPKKKKSKGKDQAVRE